MNLTRRDFLKNLGLVTAAGIVLPYVPKVIYVDMGKNIIPATSLSDAFVAQIGYHRGVTVEDLNRHMKMIADRCNDPGPSVVWVSHEQYEKMLMEAAIQKYC